MPPRKPVAKKTPVKITKSTAAIIAAAAYERGRTAARTTSPNAKLDPLNPGSPDYNDILHQYQAPFKLRTEGEGEYTRNDYLSGLKYSMALSENMAAMYSILRNLKAHTIGGGPYPAAALSNDGKGELSTELSDFLEDWFDDCDWHRRDFWDMSAICRRIVCALRDSGCILIGIDNFRGSDSTGRLLVAEASQFASMSKEEFARFWSERGPGLSGEPIDGYTLINGVVTDSDNVISGYVYDVNNRYKTESVTADCRWIPRGSSWLFGNPRTACDFTPIPEILTPYNISQSAESLRNSEVITAKNAAKVAFATTGGPGVAETVSSRSSTITDEEAVVIAEEIANGSTLPGEYTQDIEDATGVSTIGMPQGADIKKIETDKPKPSTEAHFLRIREEQGACLGAASSFARMKSDTSYTAAMNDRNMTAAHMDMDRADIERGLRKLCILRVEMDADLLGRLAKADRRWRRKIVFRWPKFRAINPQQEATAQTIRLQSGEENFLDLHGPQWRDRFDQRRKEYDESARDGGVPTTAFESTPGAIGPTTPEENGGPQQ